jgi:ADP-ribose pyrophosphatase
MIRLPSDAVRVRAIFRAPMSYSHFVMDEVPRRPWRIVASTYPIVTPWLRLRSDTIELPDGTVIDNYYVRETRGFTVVFALTPDERVVLVRQYKHGARSDVLELPAGMIDEGETPEACALRELAEETGYVGTSIELVRSFLTDPTNSDGRFYLYLVRNAEPRVATAFDLTEHITVELATIPELRAMVRDERIETGAQIAAIYTALDALQK